LGYKWEKFPLLGISWDIKFLFGDNIGNSKLTLFTNMGLFWEKAALLFVSQHWENIVTVYPIYSQTWKNMEISPHDFPSLGKKIYDAPHVFPNFRNYGNICHDFPSHGKESLDVPHAIPKLKKI